MTRAEAKKYLIRPVVSSTKIGAEVAKELEAYEMAYQLLEATEDCGDLIDAQKLYYRFGGSSQASMNPQLTVLEAPVIVKGESET